MSSKHNISKLSSSGILRNWEGGGGGGGGSTISHCIFCLKPTTRPQTGLSSYSTRRAVTFLERHLRLESPGSGSDQDHYHCMMNVCRSCTSTLETFAGLYEEIKGLELKLEGEVDKLRSVVEHASRVPTRGAWVKQCYQEEEEGHLHAGIRLEQMYTWRRTFSRKCLKKLSSNFPKVLIEMMTELPASRMDASTEQSDDNSDEDNTYVADDDDDDDLPSSSSCSTDGEEEDSVESEDAVDNENLLAATSEITSTSPPPPPVDKIKAWSCPVCSARFRTTTQYKSHYKHTHDLEGAGMDMSQALKCSKCPAYFISLRPLSQHIIHVHQNSGKIPTAEAFRTIFLATGQSSKNGKPNNKQMKGETKGQPSKGQKKKRGKVLLTCPNCGDGKDWMYQTRLDRHLKRCNTVDKGCSKCDKTFDTLAEKKLHMVTLHRGFKCDQPGCQFVTSFPQVLRRHKKGDRCPFPCTWHCTKCGDGKDWRNRTSWERHLKEAHPNDGDRSQKKSESAVEHEQTNFRKGKRFQCVKCPNFYFAANALTYHLKRAHKSSGRMGSGSGGDDVKMKCGEPGCSASFRTPSQLYSHKLKFHRGDSLQTSDDDDDDRVKAKLEPVDAPDEDDDNDEIGGGGAYPPPPPENDSEAHFKEFEIDVKYEIPLSSDQGT